MDERPRNLKTMLSEAKDTSELMIDLAYAALYFGDPDMAEEVDELEEHLSELVHEMRAVSILAARSPRDADAMASVLQVEGAIERLGNAAVDIAQHLDVRPAVVHRLDRETSGVLLFAKSPAIRDQLQALWDAVEKVYLAVVEGTPLDHGLARPLFVPRMAGKTERLLALRRRERLRRARVRALRPNAVRLGVAGPAGDGPDQFGGVSARGSEENCDGDAHAKGPEGSSSARFGQRARMDCR